jgi:hypothetical protein
LEAAFTNRKNPAGTDSRRDILFTQKKLESSNILAFYQPQLNGICPQRSGIMQVQFFHQVGTGFFNGF